MKSKLYIDSNLKGSSSLWHGLFYSLQSSTKHNRDSQCMAGAVAHSPITTVTIITLPKNI